MDNAIAVRSEQTGISTLRAARADFEEFLQLAIIPDDRDRFVIRILTMIAEMRQANVSESTYRLYSRALRAYDVVDLNAAVLHYKHTPREQGETAMPDLPSIEIVVRKCRGERRRAEEDATKRELEEDARKHAEASRGDNWREALDPDTRAAAERVQSRLSMTATLREGETVRRRQTAMRAREVQQPACTRCALMDDFSPAELRTLADQRERQAETLAMDVKEVEAA